MPDRKVWTGALAGSIVTLFLEVLQLTTGTELSTASANALVVIVTLTVSYIIPSPPGQGDNRMRSPILIALLILVSVFLTACTFTRAAYKEAENPYEVAYVMLEHYDSLLKRAIVIKERGDSPELTTELQELDLKVQLLAVPLVEAMNAYRAMQNAKTEAELIKAYNEAAVAISNFSKSLKGADNGQTSWYYDPPRDWFAVPWRQVHAAFQRPGGQYRSGDRRRGGHEGSHREAAEQRGSGRGRIALAHSF